MLWISMNSTYELSLACCANQIISFCKLRPLESPVCIINCITDALSDFFHRVKTRGGWLSIMGPPRPGFPQSTKFGLKLILPI